MPPLSRFSIPHCSPRLDVGAQMMKRRCCGSDTIRSFGVRVAQRSPRGAPQLEGKRDATRNRLRSPTVRVPNHVKETPDVSRDGSVHNVAWEADRRQTDLPRYRGTDGFAPDATWHGFPGMAQDFAIDQLPKTSSTLLPPARTSNAPRAAVRTRRPAGGRPIYTRDPHASPRRRQPQLAAVPLLTPRSRRARPVR